MSKEAKTTKNPTCIISKCPGCKPHAFQDKEYGKEMRVKNLCGKSTISKRYRCTVCLKEGDN